MAERLAQGARGAEVVTLQRLLRDAGFWPRPITGVFDPETAKALRAYQQSVGAPPTGVADPITLRALKGSASLRRAERPVEPGSREEEELEALLEQFPTRRIIEE